VAALLFKPQCHIVCCLKTALFVSFPMGGWTLVGALAHLAHFFPADSVLVSFSTPWCPNATARVDPELGFAFLPAGFKPVHEPHDELAVTWHSQPPSPPLMPR
jgi:hypothetical protein